ncbi:MAG: type II toxin-antitoxin system HicA family toxin [Chloroflexota bacterium]|nr:type II toxin-antitoxin system HicA family toxin [Anaerolineae bacterium]
MTKRRLFSSDQIIAALQRGGFEIARKTGSHMSLSRERPDGGHDVTVVKMGEPEIPKGTFDSILRLANVDYDDFLIWAKVKTKGKQRRA